MKNLTFIFFIICFNAQNLAQFSSSAIKFGNFSPAATDMGFIIGYESEKFIDRNFDIGWSVDWFHKSYIDQSLVTDFNNYYGYFESELNELRAKTNLHSIPVLFNMSAKFPMTPRFSFFVKGGLGIEALFIFYQNYQYPLEDEFQSAFDFNWRLGTGMAYQLGRYSDIIFELTYHSSNPGWTNEISDPIIGRKRILERNFDMSGFMARVGFKFYY